MNISTNTMKRTASLILSVLFAGSMLLSACSSAKSKESSETPVSETETTTESTTEETTTEETTTEETTTEETTTQETAPTIFKGNNPDQYKEITLDGVKENRFVSTDYCYIVSEKYVIFLDKDVSIPGDLTVNLDAIIDEIERQTGLSSMPDFYDYCGVINNAIYYDGYNPWEFWNIGKKIPIFLMTDRKAEGWISSACAEMALFVCYEFFSDDVWNSVPQYRDNPQFRLSCTPYDVIAHELTHTVTLRNQTMPDIFTEGPADYMSVTVLEALADKYPSIAEAKNFMYSYDSKLPKPVTAENAEEIFIEDYHTLTPMERGPEYTYGKYLCRFLCETYGEDFYKRYNDKCQSMRLDYNSLEYSEEVMKQYAQAFKDEFGEDVFTRFGDWCVKKNVLK